MHWTVTNELLPHDTVPVVTQYQLLHNTSCYTVPVVTQSQPNKFLSDHVWLGTSGSMSVRYRSAEEESSSAA